MKVKVIKSFRDKNTGELYEADSIIDVKKERAEELLKDARGLVEKVETKKRG